MRVQWELWLADIRLKRWDYFSVQENNKVANLYVL